MKACALGSAGLSGFSCKLLGEFKGIHGMLVRLFAEFVSGQMIALAVGGGRSRVGVGRKMVEFCCSIVGAR